MFASLLTYLGIPILLRVLGDSLAKVDHPATSEAVKALGDIERALGAGEIDPKALEIDRAHLHKMAELEATHLETAMKEINSSLRAEIASRDAYVRRMRPTFGYLMAITWAAQMLALAYVMIFKTSESGDVLNAMGSLGTIWTVGLSVLGIYVYKRSEDKKSTDLTGSSLLERIVSKTFDQQRIDHKRERIQHRMPGEVMDGLSNVSERDRFN